MVPISNKVASSDLNQINRGEGQPHDPGRGDAKPTLLTMPVARIKQDIKITTASFASQDLLNGHHPYPQVMVSLGARGGQNACQLEQVARPPGRPSP